MVHALIRDHARGIVELAHLRGVLPTSIDLARARPPYRSVPPEVVPEETIETYVQDYPGGRRFADDIVSSSINDGDFARYVVDGAVDDFSSLPIAWNGRSEAEIYSDWMSSLAGRLPEAEARLQDLVTACDTWRRNQAPIDSIPRFSIRIIKPGKNPEKETVDGSGSSQQRGATFT